MSLKAIITRELPQIKKSKQGEEPDNDIIQPSEELADVCLESRLLKSKSSLKLPMPPRGFHDEHFLPNPYITPRIPDDEHFSPGNHH